MDNVALVQNFSLPGEISRKFALDWSADNKIAVCTTKSIYILTSYCSPVESGFPPPLHKQVIRAPEKAMVLEPLTIPPNPYNYIKSEEDRVNLFQLLMDHTLNPTCPERAEAFRSYRCARWSPKGAARANRCLLATLTMDHRLCIYEEKEKEWKCICDLTEEMQAERNARKEVEAAESKQGRRKKKRKELKSKESRPRTRTRIQYIGDSSDEEEDAFSNISKYLNYEKLVERTYKLAAMEITWTGMFGSPATSINDTSYEYCYLIVGMKSGHIQFWKFSPSDGNVITLAHEWDTGLGLLTTLFWQQTSPTAGFLMCGTLKGILAFLPITVCVDSDQEPKVLVKNMCKVWDEEDQIAVDQIAVLKIALKKYVIIAAKQRALVGCEIALTDSSIIIRNVGHSFGLHNLPIAGMSVLDAAMPQYRVLIASMEGLLVEIKVSLGNDEIKFQHEKVGIDVDLKNLMIQGLAVSSNGLLCSLILNPASYFDHLAKKEALQFVMFVTRPFEEIYTKLKSVLKPQFSFSPVTSGSVSKHTDFFECIRINLACGTPLPDWLTAFLDSDPVTYENASAMELYCMRFLLCAYTSGLATAAPKDKGNLELKLYTVEAIIMRNYISKVFVSCQDKIDLLTPAQGQSLLLMADYLFKEFQMPVESLYSALGCETPMDAETLPAREICRICKGEVKLDNIKVGQCDKNHMFARCCQSLLLCDIIPYFQCTSCKSLALQDVWSFGLTCTYCGMPMT